MPSLADCSSPDIIARLPAPARVAIAACMAELAKLDLENWRITLAALLVEFEIAERRAAEHRRPH
jgi:hypothetical protein